MSCCHSSYSPIEKALVLSFVLHSAAGAALAASTVSHRLRVVSIAYVRTLSVDAFRSGCFSPAATPSPPPPPAVFETVGLNE